MLNLAVWNVRRLNKRDHRLALKDLASEFRLHFLGILETRVQLNNVMHIQSYLLPQWKWFADYNSIGNRIWLAWDENFIDVHVLDLGEQFVQCRITSRVVNESVIVTVVYGATEVTDRQILWTTLETLAQQCSDVPWLVGGDFNAVRDLNEVCGISGDIRMSTVESNTGILEAGLIPLPMQGAWFTWHNCSTTARSLWKRLDRILINDCWLARFPTSSYHSLTTRTSDHSPLVLHGDSRQLNGGMFRFDNYLALSPEFIPNVQSIWHHEVVDIPMYAVTRKLKALKPVFRLQRRNKGDLTLNVQLAKGFLDEAQQLQRAKMQWMKDGDQCSRVFFRKIAQRQVMRRILQINDKNGTTHTDQGEVAHEFVSYYQNLLGVFDIAEDKALGPDGYSLGFFKATWPVVGEEVTRAVLDFFSTEKLLKHINSTILALVPKRLSILLDKIISPRQTAFIPGRSIGDNIMLAQELFSGYNQMRLPPRCALKVDIRKAYDTVEWDFLLAVLQLFGFPPKFTRWIEECVSTTSFLIGLNGKPHGFFFLGKALHLGFLQRIEQDMQFTYHLKCESSKVFQMGFADDLLLFCRANFDSNRVFKEGLDWFAEVSGLRLNVQKSHLIISHSAQELKDQMLEILGFQEGHLPMSLYWASAFILPMKVINEIEKRLRNFLWKGTTSSGYAKVAGKMCVDRQMRGDLGSRTSLP
ncbi:UNVERIFIED_CONTAM: hypothetical protein Sindi_1663400 [Sesamum indicum]